MIVGTPEYDVEQRLLKIESDIRNIYQQLNRLMVSVSHKAERGEIDRKY